MLKDAYGNRLSTTSTEARDAYDLGVRRFLGAEPGVQAAFTAAIEADANFALALLDLQGSCSCAPSVAGSKSASPAWRSWRTG